MTSVKAYVDDFNLVTVSISRSFFAGSTTGFYLIDEQGKEITCYVTGRTDFEQRVVYALNTEEDLMPGNRYYLRESHGQTIPVTYRFITHKKEFNDLFTYYDEDLGCFYHTEYTDFALWAPTACNVVLKLYTKNNIELFNMQRSTRGVYRIRIQKDLASAEYTYLVDRNGEIVETLDPYGLSSNANSRHSAVIDTTKITSIKDTSVLPKLNSVCDAIIYECNVRDISSIKTSGITDKGYYSGAYEKNTKYKEYPTGMDHIKSLGITHIQLQPVLDFATVDEFHPNTNYNWGYDASECIALEGSYSKKPNDPYDRMIEFKKLVNAYHNEGIRVNLDIVYNHMYDTDASPLQKAVPYYYYRYDDRKLLSNGSYCGNDLESRQPMTRHLFLYALKTLVKLYNVDGYRFDLMGILDVDTMNDIVKTLKKEKEDIMIYGEGWDLPTALTPEEKSRIFNQFKMPNIGHFNDTFRDVLRGGNGEYVNHERGYITGNLDKAFDACSVFSGNTMSNPYFLRFDSPIKSVNALETHDNLTCWDKMHYCCGEEDSSIRIKRQCMMIASILFSQGIPFLHAGMEFCGTKNNIQDSYNAGDDINGMHYERMEKYNDVVNYTKKCIAFRKNHTCLRYSTKELIDKHVSFEVREGIVFYNVYDENETLKIIVNPSLEDKWYSFDESWKVVFDFYGNEWNDYSNNIQVPSCSIIVIKR